jgi:hypothetical protein
LIYFKNSAEILAIFLFPGQKTSKEFNRSKTNLCPADKMKNAPLALWPHLISFKKSAEILAIFLLSGQNTSKEAYLSQTNLSPTGKVAELLNSPPVFAGPDQMIPQLETSDVLTEWCLSLWSRILMQTSTEPFLPPSTTILPKTA